MLSTGFVVQDIKTSDLRLTSSTANEMDLVGYNVIISELLGKSFKHRFEIVPDLKRKAIAEQVKILCVMQCRNSEEHCT